MSDSKHQEIEMGKSTIKDLEKQTLNKIKYAQSGSKKNKLYLHAEYKDIEREVIE